MSLITTVCHTKKEGLHNFLSYQILPFISDDVDMFVDNILVGDSTHLNKQELDEIFVSAFEQSW